MGLDALQNIRRGDPNNFLLGEIFGDERKATAEETKALEKLDWTSTMIAMNGWYDRIAASMRLPDRADRLKESMKIEEELQARRKKVLEAGNLAKFIAGKDGDKAAGQRGRRCPHLIARAVGPEGPDRPRSRRADPPQPRSRLRPDRVPRR